MLSREENDLVTQTAAGTPGGDMMRRYWQPVALSTDLPEGGAPVPVQVMGEELALFRDEFGRIGLLGIHCAHRAADLSYGRIEDGGLRCLYHGWLYDVTGQCLDQPGEPEGSRFKEKVRAPRLPVPGVGRLGLRLHGPGRGAAAPELPLAHRSRRAAHRAQGASVLQLPAGQRGEHRPAAPLVPPPPLPARRPLLLGGRLDGPGGRRRCDRQYDVRERPRAVDRDRGDELRFPHLLDPQRRGRRPATCASRTSCTPTRAPSPRCRVSTASIGTCPSTTRTTGSTSSW